MSLRTLRSALVAVRDSLDGRLHPRRRARAVERLQALKANSVLFLCLGNVCRSPYGARALAARAPRVEVESAGFIGPGRPPPDTAQEVAHARGIDHADHRSKTIDQELLRYAEAIFLFDRFNVARLRAFAGPDMRRVFWLGDFDPIWSGKRAIIDPWGKSPEEFDRTFARIERCVDEVARILER